MNGGGRVRPARGRPGAHHTGPPSSGCVVRLGAPGGGRNGKGEAMSVLKVIEVLAESDKSWEDAAQKAVDKAKQSLHGIKSIYIENFEAKVDNGQITSYRVNGKITFMLD